jgi:hypothetical protein
MPTYSSTPLWRDLIREAPGRFTYCTGKADSLLARTASARRQGRIPGFGRYTLDNFTTLLTDLRAQILNQDAVALETTSYGQLYEIRAPLVGPSGRTLRVRTIWMTEYLSGVTKFITLIPD